MIDKIKNEVERIEEDSLHSAKGHFSAANIWFKCHFWLGLITTILSGTSGASIIIQLGTKYESFSIIAGILSLLATICAGLITFFNPQEKGTNHLKVGNNYNSLRNQSRIFYTIELSGQINEQEALKKLNELANQRDKLNTESPPIPRWAYELGKKSIKNGEAAYAVDIDKKN